MAWDHLSVNKPHLVYLILGGFTSLFMLCSSFIKERMYIGEATVATICGIIFGPHAANLINPNTWGNADQITLEFSRIVLVVQCFAVGVELPKYYMEKHWRSVVFLLIPVMTSGWLITSLIIWWMIPPLDWLQSLCCAACVTATDPVLASSVVGKGKFAKRVPKHLRDVLSAESGCNDGMAFPFIYLALYLLEYKPDSNKVSFNWFIISILYECVFGALYGFVIGYIGRHGIKYAEKHDLVDRESFLVFYFVLALFCAGSGSILGVDDLLVGFAAGVGFSNDGWFTQKTEESHVSNVIDLLINLAYFVYLGTIIPWGQYNNPAIGTTVWRLVVISIFVILFRRIPIMLALKPLIPDIKNFREALFAGHFGPIGVGAIFVAILARAELETGSTTPLSEYPDVGAKNYMLVAVIWPITTFLVISSIIVHGSSIAVFTLGKHINTLTITMSYTTAHEDGPSWMNRLPRISSTSKSQARSNAGSETDAEDLKMADLPPGTLPPVGMPGNFLRRQKEEDNPSRNNSRPSSLIPRRRKKKWDDGRGPGGPITQSAIYPQRSHSEPMTETLPSSQTPPEDEKDQQNIDEDEQDERPIGEVQDDAEMHEILHRDDDEEKLDQHISNAERHPEEIEMYDEGGDIIIEDADGEVLSAQKSPEGERKQQSRQHMQEGVKEGLEHPNTGYKNLRKKLGVWRHKDEADEDDQVKQKPESHRKRGPALAYQFGNTIIVEDEDGEVVKTYQLPPQAKQRGISESGPVRQGVARMGTWTGLGGNKRQEASAGSEVAESSAGPSTAPTTRPSAVRQGLSRMGTWGFGGKNTESPNKPGADSADDDRRIRFTIGGAGRRMTKEDFLKEIQSLDPKARCEIVDKSDAPEAIKAMAKRDASEVTPGSSRIFGAREAQATSGKGTAKKLGAEMARQKGASVPADEVDGSGDDSSGREKERLRQKRQQAMLDLARASSSSSSSTEGNNSSPNASPSHTTFSKLSSPSTTVPETAAERRRRTDALKGVDNVTSAQRGRPGRPARDADNGAGAGSGTSAEAETGTVTESAAERRRREAALGLAGGGSPRTDGEEDSDDDDTPRVPPPAKQRSRGIRFAESPVRRGRGGG